SELAPVFQRAPEGVADGDAVEVAQFRAAQLRLHRFDVRVFQRSRAHVGQPAPGVAATRVDIQCRPVTRYRLVDASQVQQGVAEQDGGRRQLLRQLPGDLEQRHRFHAHPARLWVATD